MTGRSGTSSTIRSSISSTMTPTTTSRPSRSASEPDRHPQELAQYDVVVIGRPPYDELVTLPALRQWVSGWRSGRNGCVAQRHEYYRYYYAGDLADIDAVFRSDHRGGAMRILDFWYPKPGSYTPRMEASADSLPSTPTEYPAGRRRLDAHVLVTLLRPSSGP